MKLIVTIPAYNEEETLAAVIRSVPRKIKGITEVKILVYDDGSEDRTVAIAHKVGADYVLQHKQNFGLARTFRDAVKESLKLGADIIVNTDADNQYKQAEIKALVAPVINQEADLVIGNRQVETLEHMSWKKKYGNMLGSYAIRLLTGTTVRDASSGFRAFTKELANRVLIFSSHTYTHEMIIGAHFRGFIVKDIPVTFKARTTGQSRLISKGVTTHVAKSGATILRSLLLYKALVFFTIIGGIFIGAGTLGILRFLYFALILGHPQGHIQSLVLSSILVGIGFNILVIGFIADMISYNRRLIEEKIG